MPGPQPTPITLTAKQRALLERLVRRQTSPQRLVRRATIILEMDSGSNNGRTARRLRLSRKAASNWRKRWLEAVPALAVAEAEGDDRAVGELIEAVLADEPRSGAPGIFTPEQITQIVALACEDPEACGRPVSHWTSRELADEAVKRGIVERISPRSVGRFLKSGRFEATSQPLLAQLGARGPGHLQPSSDKCV